MAFPIAHRGLPTQHPENSLAAITAALQFVTVVEIDVRCTSDNVPVCTHDASLGRTHAHGSRVGHLTAAELRDVAPDMPTLAQALDAIAAAGGAVMLDVKVTRPNMVDAILEVVERSKITWNDGKQLRRGEPIDAGTATFQSADAAVLQSVRSRTGAGTLELIRGHSSKRELVLTAPFISAYAQGVTIPDALATKTVLRALQRLRLGTYVYTINDEARYSELAEAGASAVYTDDVARLA
jgi:glycerophosphoryl diester phosphodiesterase